MALANRDLGWARSLRLRSALVGLFLAVGGVVFSAQPQPGSDSSTAQAPSYHDIEQRIDAPEGWGRDTGSNNVIGQGPAPYTVPILGGYRNA